MTFLFFTFKLKKLSKLKLFMVFSLEKDPIDLFSRWYKEVLNQDPNIMTLATCNKDCIPSARIVLLKRYSKEGFIFFTNINSRKGKELLENPAASLVFHWIEVSRQVRVEGSVKLLDNDKSDEYFSSRSRNSKISAWCSKQSSIMLNWENFEHEIKLAEQKFHDKEIPRPDFWLGFCIAHKTVEFWQEGEHRRHVRFKYTFAEKNSCWKIDQLYP